ncbi:MAG: hypothetical protein DSY42_00915, partial [Aquifex sp.]
METINLELRDILDPANNIKTQEIRAIEVFFFAEAEQVYKQIREVLAVRLSNDIRAVVQRLGSIERLKYLHPQDSRSFMRALYVNLMMGNYLGRLHTLKQAGEEKEFSNVAGSFEIPFEEAIKFMRSLVPMTRDEFDRLSQELKFRAFTIARVFSLDVINRIKERYIKALQRGETISDVMRFLDETLEKIGISERNPYWLEVHARNNFLTAYNAGRWAQITKAKTVKYLVYNAILDERTTKLCKSLDGVVRPKDDPFWDRFMPPNHHSCRSLATVVKNEFAYLKRIKSTSRKKIEKLEKLIEEDKQLKREFQFRASPVKSLTGIPPSVFERAKEYEVVEEFLMFNVKTKLWDKIIKELKKKSLPEWKIGVHEKQWKEVFGFIPDYKTYKKMINDTLENP